jgi:hypothetical protein
VEINDARQIEGLLETCRLHWSFDLRGIDAQMPALCSGDLLHSQLSGNQHSFLHKGVFPAHNDFAIATNAVALLF